MNKRKRIYSGFNRRKKKNSMKIASLVCICVVGVYGAYKIIDYTNLKDKIISLKMPSIDMFDFLGKEKEEYTFNDIEDEISKPDKEEETTQEVKSTTIDGWKFYSIQIASVDDSKEYEKLEEDLISKKVPYSIVKIDDTSKVQTYGSLNKETVKLKIDKIREIYPDAFISEIDIPVLSLQYTEKYSYTEKISTQLNELVETFKSESEFWEKENVDMALYNEILTKRKATVEVIQEEADKIDYEGAKIFKENLITYVDNLEKNIDESSKNANLELYEKSQSLFLNSMQDYLLFINSIQ